MKYLRVSDLSMPDMKKKWTCWKL